MKKVILLLIFALPALFANAQNWIWEKGSEGDSGGFGITTDDGGNVYAIGTFSGHIHGNFTIFGRDTLINSDISEGSMFLVKYNSTGKLIWAKSYGGTGDQFGIGITSDHSGHICITGLFNGNQITLGNTTITTNNNPDNDNVFTAKLDTNGNVIWAKVSSTGTIGYSANSQGDAIALDNSGNTFVTGTFSGKYINFDNTILYNDDTSGRAINAFIVKYDFSGNFLWAHSYGQSFYTPAVACDAAGNVYVTNGFSSDSILIGNMELHNTDTISHSTDGYIIKFDPAGNIVRVNTLGGSDVDIITALTVDLGGNIILAGYSFSADIIVNNKDTIKNNLSGFFTCKLDSSGNFSWLKFGVDSNGRPPQVSVITTDVFGNIYAAGVYAGEISFDNITLYQGQLSMYGGVFLVSYNTQGKSLWAEKVDMFKELNANCHGIATDKTGNVFISGTFAGSFCLFDADSLTNQFYGHTESIAYLAKAGSALAGIPEVTSNKNLIIYPNPNNGEFYIDLSDYSSAELSVFNMLGQSIYQTIIENENHKEINLKGISAGLYVVQLFSKDGTYTGKVIVR